MAPVEHAESGRSRASAATRRATERGDSPPAIASRTNASSRARDRARDAPRPLRSARTRRARRDRARSSRACAPPAAARPAGGAGTRDDRAGGAAQSGRTRCGGRARATIGHGRFAVAYAASTLRSRSVERACRSLEVAVPPDRSHQPRHARHRQDAGRRHRRAHAERRPQDASRPSTARRSASRSASRSSSQRAARRAAASSSSAPARAAGSACSRRPRCRPPSARRPTLVQAIMAGGQDAVFRAREGVEDNYEEGARSIARLRVDQDATSSSASRRAA